ncbi:MAG: TauD/TfdA family dioxygenase, partial [bacterium]|nr:TauD/TfdA family dioxygenase [bacterium]
WIHPMDRLAGVDSAEPSELRVKSDHQLLTDRWHLDVLYAPNPPAVTEHATNPSVTCRWRWRNGDVVIWDERCTAHFAVRDPWEGERVLRRLLVEGDCPVTAN